MIADKMPAPGKSRGDYGSTSEDAADGGADDASEGDGDEEMEVSTMADFRKCLKSGDDQGALGHLRDLVSMLSDPGEKDE